jgi:hypothetical protein
MQAQRKDRARIWKKQMRERRFVPLPHFDFLIVSTDGIGT